MSARSGIRRIGAPVSLAAARSDTGRERAEWSDDGAFTSGPASVER